MGLRYRSSIGQKLFRFNFSGSGISMSVGPRGYSSVNHQLVDWLGRRKRRPRLNVNLPLGFSTRDRSANQPRAIAISCTRMSQKQPSW